MVVYRAGKGQFAGNLSGEGARQFPGRWNLAGIPCIYASASRALAVLEFTVNRSLVEIPRWMSIASIEIPEDQILRIPVSELPGNWRDSPAPYETQKLGSDLMQRHASPILQLPSIIIPEESNFILNPFHPASPAFKIIDIQDHIYDIRIKLK